MLKQIIDFLKEADCGVSFSLEDGILTIHLKRLQDGKIKVLDQGITEELIWGAYAPDFILGRILYQWENEDEYYNEFKK